MTGLELTREDVEIIHERLKNGDKGVDIARDFCVSQQSISAIRTGANWAHVTGVKPGDVIPSTYRGALTRAQAEEADAELRAGTPVGELARRFGVTYQTIYHIQIGFSWAWLTGRPKKQRQRT